MQTNTCKHGQNTDCHTLKHSYYSEAATMIQCQILQTLQRVYIGAFFYLRRTFSLKLLEIETRIRVLFVRNDLQPNNYNIWKSNPSLLLPTANLSYHNNDKDDKQPVYHGWQHKSTGRAQTMLLNCILLLCLKCTNFQCSESLPWETLLST